MTTAGTVLEKAIAHASLRTDADEAGEDLLATCQDNRVAIVRALRKMLEGSDEYLDNDVATRTKILLDEALRRGPWDVA